MAEPSHYINAEGNIGVICSCGANTDDNYDCPACGLRWQVEIDITPSDPHGEASA